MAPRLILGIETSGPRTGVALIADERTLFEESAPSAGHNERLFPLIRRALAAGGTKPARLSLIGVSIGPGMFSALRVGLAAAKGLALPHAVPLKAVGTLPALAATVSAAGLVLAVIDARKAQVYVAFYRDGRQLIEPCVASPAELPRLLAGHADSSTPIAIAGSGTQLCLEVLRDAGLSVQMTGVEAPSPSTIACLADRLLSENGPDDLAGLEPRYLRRTDAELSRIAAG